MTQMVYGQAPDLRGDPVLPRWWRTVDKLSLSCVMALCAIGILLSLAASPPLADRNGMAQLYYVQRQVVFGSVSMAVMLTLTMLNPVLVRRLAFVGFGCAFIALCLLPIIGEDHGKGATRWMSVAGISLQPSEFLKPGFVVVTAWLVAASHEINGPPGRKISALLAMAVVALLVSQPDFGQSALILFSWGVVFFLGGAPIALIAGAAGLVVLGGVIAYHQSSHFAGRITGFLNPDVAPTEQLGYATSAIQQGGILGQGVGEGSVKWFLPDGHTDFIIAVAAEEYGLIFVLAIIALYGVIVVRSLWRLMAERDLFIRLAGAGLVSIFGVQALVNMGVAVRLLPAKGMTLPFISYGGSSLLAAGITLGMLLAFTRSRPQGHIRDMFVNRQGQ